MGRVIRIVLEIRYFWFQPKRTGTFAKNFQDLASGRPSIIPDGCRLRENFRFRKTAISHVKSMGGGSTVSVGDQVFLVPA